jgi:hypothetical protein
LLVFLAIIPILISEVFQPLELLVIILLARQPPLRILQRRHHFAPHFDPRLPHARQPPIKTRLLFVALILLVLTLFHYDFSHDLIFV